MQLFYYPDLRQHTIYLPEDESKHLVKVLRKKKGDFILLADGKGNTATGVIDTDHPKRCAVSIRDLHHHIRTRKYHLHIVIAPTKQAERMDWFVEKAVETGVDEISFMSTANSERLKLNTDRFEKIAVSAMKQSKQYWLPAINPLRGLSDLIGLNQNSQAIKLIAWCETDVQKSLKEALSGEQHQSIIVLIGPEGDFTPAEIEEARTAGFAPVSLGSTILRTETAGIFVCAAVHAMLA